MQYCSICDVFSHLEQNCCKYTSFGTCSFVLSELFVSCVVSKLEKYVQHMLAGGRHVHQWTHNTKMAGLFILFTCDTVPIVAFVRILFDQSASRSVILTKHKCALPFILHFHFVLIEAFQTPKVPFAYVTWNFSPCRCTRKTYYTVTTYLSATTPYLHPLLQPWQTYRLDKAPVRLAMT